MTDTTFTPPFHLHEGAMPAQKQIEDSKGNYVGTVSTSCSSLVLSALNAYKGEPQQSGGSEGSGKLYTESEVEAFVRATMTETMAAIPEWLEKDTEIYYIGTDTVAEGVELSMKPGADRFTTHYIYPRLRKHGINFIEECAEPSHPTDKAAGQTAETADTASEIIDMAVSHQLRRQVAELREELNTQKHLAKIHNMSADLCRGENAKIQGQVKTLAEALEQIVVYGNAGKTITTIDSHVSKIARTALSSLQEPTKKD